MATVAVRRPVDRGVPGRSGRRVPRTLACSLALGLAAALPAPGARVPDDLPSPRARWVRVETQHVTVVADVPTLRAQLVADTLDQLHGVLAANGGPPARTVRLKVTAYVLSSEGAFRRYAGLEEGASSRVAATFWSGQEGPVVVLLAPSLETGLALACQALAREEVARRFERLPPWFVVGTAALYSTFRGTSETVEIGLPSESYQRVLHGLTQIPVAEVLAATAEPAAATEPVAHDRFLATSWALVHYLVLDESALGARLPEYLDLVARGASPDEACRAAFGRGVSELQDAVARHVRVAEYRSVLLSAPPREGAAPRTTPALPPADALAALGDLLRLAPGGDLEAAERLYRAAIAADPACGRAHSGLAALLDRTGRHDEAAGEHAAALATAPDDALVLRRHAASLLARVDALPAGASGVEIATRATAEALRAFEIEPERAEALDVAVGACEAIGSTETPCFRAFEQARHAMPARLDLVVRLAALYATVGNTHRARALLESGLSSGVPEVRAAAEAMLAALPAREAGAADAGPAEPAAPAVPGEGP